jgi:hypothetical protein
MRSQRLILGGLWIFIVIVSLWDGWHLPNSAEAVMFPDGNLGVLLAVAPLLGAFVAAVSPTRFIVFSWPKVGPLIDRLFGEGVYRTLFVELGFALWLGVGAALYGAVGVARAIVLDAPRSAHLMGLFFLSTGIAMFILYTVVHYRLGRTHNEPYNS